MRERLSFEIPMCEWLSFEIPASISANHLNANVAGKGRVKTDIYKTWQDSAGWLALEQIEKPVPHFPGDVLVWIDLPPGLDVDNLKAAVDLLQMPQAKRLQRSIGIISDDKRIQTYVARRVAKGMPCVVRVTPVGEWE